MPKRHCRRLFFPHPPTQIFKCPGYPTLCPVYIKSRCLKGGLEVSGLRQLLKRPGPSHLSLPIVQLCVRVIIEMSL